MSVSALAAAMLLTGATPATDAVPPGGPVPAVVFLASEQEVPAAQSVPADAAPVRDASSTNDGVIAVTARARIAGDPLEKVNAQSFAVTEAVDKAVLGPVAMGFQRVVPEPARNGFRNFINNLHEITVFVNFLLQHKLGKAAATLGRFTINSTIGVAGLVDVAKRKPFGLRPRANGFADTLGFYGVKPGAFLFIPIVGATTVRDLAGDIVDRLLMPLSFGAPFNQVAYTVPSGSIGMLDRRAQFDDQLQKLRSSSDRYAARRVFYLSKRAAEIAELRGERLPGKPETELADTAIAPPAAVPTLEEVSTAPR